MPEPARDPAEFRAGRDLLVVVVFVVVEHDLGHVRHAGDAMGQHSGQLRGQVRRL